MKTQFVKADGARIPALGFELSPQDMAAIFALARPGSRIVDPCGLAPEWD